MENELDKKLNTGLTNEEVEKLKAQGLINGELDVKTKSYGQIIKENVFSLFNLVNTILLICIIYVGSWKNGLFYFVVISNILIGIIQEIRAKQTIEKLSLISAPKANVLRDGKFLEIHNKDIVLGDIMRLKNGNQICADAVIIDGNCQVNESLLTGESNPIEKKKGDRLLSGSFLISGRVLAEVEHIGDDNYVNKITKGAKYLKKSDSVIMHSVKSIVRIIAIAIIPLAILLIWSNFFRVDQSFTDAMVRTVAAVASMIPGGLVLLVSMVLAVSVIRLAVHKTLVQDLYCVENLARVDVLCLDKTGTITEGVMSVEEIIPLGSEKVTSRYSIGRDEAFNGAPKDADCAISRFVLNMDDENPTINAIRNHYEINYEDVEDNIARCKDSIEMIHFSSDKKWSLVYFKEENKSYIMGAPEFVNREIYESQKNIIEEYTKSAKRVILFAEADASPKDGILPDNIRPIALIIISDKVRKGVEDTLEFFNNEGVALKVISGDDPVTVYKVAKEAGLSGAEKYVDATTLSGYEDILNVVDDTTIFGRVTPYQKVDIIKALKEKGHTVAMTGDGANDVLALKEADCSVAMQSGSEAARNVSNMVLLDSSFDSFPLVIAEGRKSINNLQRSASLYLTKTTYAFIMAILFIFLGSIQYPFENIQITLIGGLTIGIPSFFLALEPNNNRIKKNFLYNVLRIAIPSGVMTFMAMMASVLYSTFVLHAERAQVSTVTTYVALAVGFIIILNICGRLNLWKGILIACLLIMAVLAPILTPDLFSLAPIDGRMWIMLVVIAIIYLIVHTILIRVVIPRIEKRKGEV